MSIAAFISHYGYLAIFLGMIVEGETFLILGGFSAHEGLLQLPVVILSAFIGTFIVVEVLFFIGRAQGTKIINKRPHWEPKIAKIHYHFDRHDVKVLLIFRFLIGFRTIIPLIVGTTKVSAARFAILNAIGAAIWAITIAYLGYLFGRAFEVFFGKVEQFETIAFVIFIGVTAIVLGIHHIVKKKREEKEIREQKKQ